MRISLALAALPLLSPAACAPYSPGMTSAPLQVASTVLRDASGVEKGTVTATAVTTGIRIDLAVSGVSPGPRGVHVHTTGACTPTFAAAGGHWNPDGHAHGLLAEGGQHAGDMPNIEVGADGRGTLTYTLGGGATFAGLLDADGSAFVVHAGPDDQLTDPTGNSGDRIACGVFAAG